MVRGGKRLRVIHLHRQFEISAGPDIEAEAGIGLVCLGENEHDGPVALAEDAQECLLIGATGRGAASRMGVQPDAGELFRLAPQVHLLLKEIGDRRIVKSNRDLGTALLHGEELLDQQRIVRGRNAKAADLGTTGMTKTLQFRPGRGGEPQDGIFRQLRVEGQHWPLLPVRCQ